MVPPRGEPFKFPSKSFPNISVVWQKSMTKSPKAFTNPPVSSKVLSLQALHFSLQSLQRHLDASSLAGGQFSIYKHVPQKKRTYCTNVFKYKQNHIAMATHTEICFAKVTVVATQKRMGVSWQSLSSKAQAGGLVLMSKILFKWVAEAERKYSKSKGFSQLRPSHHIKSSPDDFFGIFCNKS